MGLKEKMIIIRKMFPDYLTGFLGEFSHVKRLIVSGPYGIGKKRMINDGLKFCGLIQGKDYITVVEPSGNDNIIVKMLLKTMSSANGKLLVFENCGNIAEKNIFAETILSYDGRIIIQTETGINVNRLYVDDRNTELFEILQHGVLDYVKYMRSIKSSLVAENDLNENSFEAICVFYESAAGDSWKGDCSDYFSIHNFVRAVRIHQQKNYELIAGAFPQELFKYAKDYFK